jgi:hypothetical protein
MRSVRVSAESCLKEILVFERWKSLIVAFALQLPDRLLSIVRHQGASEAPHNESPQPLTCLHTSDDPMQGDSKEDQSANGFEELLHGNTILYCARAISGLLVLNVAGFGSGP